MPALIPDLQYEESPLQTPFDQDFGSFIAVTERVVKQVARHLIDQKLVRFDGPLDFRITQAGVKVDAGVKQQIVVVNDVRDPALQRSAIRLFEIGEQTVSQGKAGEEANAGSDAARLLEERTDGPQIVAIGKHCL